MAGTGRETHHHLQLRLMGFADRTGPMGRPHGLTPTYRRLRPQILLCIEFGPYLLIKLIKSFIVGTNLVAEFQHLFCWNFNVFEL
jgi:hypothetical protein